MTLDFVVSILALPRSSRRSKCVRGLIFLSFSNALGLLAAVGTFIDSGVLVVSLRLLWMVVVWLLSSLGFCCLCLVCLFVWLFLFSVSYGVTLIWVFVCFVLPFCAGSPSLVYCTGVVFVLHGPNLGISVVLVFSCAGSPSLVYGTEFGCVAWP